MPLDPRLHPVRRRAGQQADRDRDRNFYPHELGTDAAAAAVRDPFGHGRASRACDLAPRPAARLQRAPGAARGDARSRRGRDAGGHRPQRRRQDDPAEDPRHAPEAERRLRRGARRRASATRLPCPRAHRLPRPLSAALPGADGDREPRVQRTPARHRAGAAADRASCSRRRASTAAATSGSATSRRACSSAPRSAGRSCTNPSCCCSTSPRSHLDVAGAEVVEGMLAPRPDRSRVVVTHELERGIADADRGPGAAADGSVAYCGAAEGLAAAEARELYSGVVR